MLGLRRVRSPRASALALLLLLAGAASALAREPVRTGFDPQVDGLPFENLGDFNSPLGNCWGMSLLAIDGYLRRQAGQLESPGARPVDQRANFPEQHAASWAQATAEQVDMGTENPRAPVSDPTQMNAALDRIAASGVPEVMTIQFKEGAHAVVVYGHEDGKLLTYDPNFPGETIRWPFDPEKGLGRHPKARAVPMYGQIVAAGSTPFAQHNAAARIAAIRDACAANEAECTDRFPLSTANLERQPDGSVVVTGTVARGSELDIDGNPTKRPNRAWISVNGRVVGSVPISRFGTYRAVVPRGALRDGEPNTVRVVLEAPLGGGQTTFAGARDFAVPVTDAAPVAARPTRRPAPGGQQPAGRPSRTRGLVGALAGE